MQFSVYGQQRTAHKLLLCFSLLLTSWGVVAGSRSSLPEALDANTLSENRPVDGNNAPLSNDLSSPPAQETRLDRLRDMAIEESLAEGYPSATVISPFRTPFKSISPPSSGSSNPNQIRGLPHSMEETIRPSYKETVNSGVIDAIRSVMSAPPNHQDGFIEANSEKEGERNPLHQVTQGRTWDETNQSSAALSHEQKAANHIKAEIMLMALIDEITPWALSIVGLYALFHIGRFGRTYLRRKAGRHRRRRHSGTSSYNGNSSTYRSSGTSSGRRHRHRSRSTPHSAPVELDRSVKKPSNSPTS